MKKIIGIIIGILILGIIGIGSYLKFGLPDVGPAPKMTINATPQQIERGKYLAMHVAVCIDCHSTRDWTKYSGPVVPGTLGKGGEFFGPKMGFPGSFYSKNLTPYNLKSWTDGEIFRAITTGVDKDGKALFPVMPYTHYRKMDKQDVKDIIAYLRTLKPIANTTPAAHAKFPMNFIINTIPSKASFTTIPQPSDTLAYGAYLTNIAGCIECHTKIKKGQIIENMAFAGGRAFQMPNGTVYSANITPDKKTGIGKWSATDFVTYFKHFADSANIPKMKQGEINTIMPWTMYAGMDTADLRSIYAYLQTQKPISNIVPVSQKQEQNKPNR